MTYEEKKNIVIDNYFKMDCDINTTIKEAYTKGFNRGADKQRSVVEAKQKEIDSLKERYSWISVDERLPDKEGDYIVRYYDKFVHEFGLLLPGITYFDEREESFGQWVNDTFYRTKVSLWMPLPELPKEEIR